MIKLSKSKLATILNNHNKWLKDNNTGKRADLTNADLSGADLTGADLTGADLSGVKLTNANLTYADLREADLSNANLTYANLIDAKLTNTDLYYANLDCANLTEADLRGANLTEADLRGANLSGADLDYANLRGAYLSNANLDYANLRGAYLSNANLSNIKYNETTNFIALQCPESGSFIGYKKLQKNKIAKLLIPASAKRSSATNRKCRASKAKVLSITSIDGKIAYDSGVNLCNNLDYCVGEYVLPDSFDENRWNDCSNGIHFFITREEAVQY